MGETLVEIMRTEVDKPLNETALFSGPYPSGSSAIMISTVARMGHSCGIISGVGKDSFGECMLNRLRKDGVDVSKVLVDPDGSTACAGLWPMIIKVTADICSIGMILRQPRQ